MGKDRQTGEQRQIDTESDGLAGKGKKKKKKKKKKEKKRRRKKR